MPCNAMAPFLTPPNNNNNNIVVVAVVASLCVNTRCIIAGALSTMKQFQTSGTMFAREQGATKKNFIVKLVQFKFKLTFWKNEEECPQLIYDIYI